MRAVTIATVALLVIAAGAWASGPADVLKGAKSLYVVAPTPALDDITEILIKELPQVNLEGSRDEADVILRFIVTSPTPVPAVRDDTAPSGEKAGKIGHQENQIRGDVIATVSRQEANTTVVVYMGPAKENTAADFAREVVKSWKEANP